jgi:hypothetical protein
MPGQMSGDWKYNRRLPHSDFGSSPPQSRLPSALTPNKETQNEQILICVNICIYALYILTLPSLRHRLVD